MTIGLPISPWNNFKKWQTFLFFGHLPECVHCPVENKAIKMRKNILGAGNSYLDCNSSNRICNRKCVVAGQRVSDFKLVKKHIFKNVLPRVRNFGKIGKYSEVQFHLCGMMESLKLNHLGGGAVAEESNVLLLREKINENQMIPSGPPLRPWQS